MFKALLLTKTEDGRTEAALTDLEESRLPEGEVRVQVEWSTLNYKDGLAITGKAPVVRKFPMVPGIDFAGTVLESSDARYKPADPVLLNGWGVGEGHWGGLAGQARVKADWLLPIPAGLDARQAMPSSAGRARSIASAVIRSPMSAPASSTAARWPRADWRRAWTFRPVWRPSSCAA